MRYAYIMDLFVGRFSFDLPEVPAIDNVFNFVRSDDSKGPAANVLSLPSVPDKTDGTVALVRSGPEKGKTTPAGEYLTAALMDFDPEQYDGLAAIADGANKLLMLVGMCSFCFLCAFPDSFLTIK